MSSMRTGADYRESLRDGRRVWILGDGLIDDVTTHPATQPMVDEYVAWYDRHFDPKWQDTVLMPPDEGGVRRPVGYLVPRSADDLRRMGRCFSATTFPSAGNITHTPAYGHLIALGVLHAVGLGKARPEQLANAEAYRAEIARTGRFLTFAAGAATIGYRLREDPAERAALRIVGQSDAGVVIRGKIGMLTSPAFAEEVYVGAVNGADLDGQRATFVVPVNAPGVTVICRKASARAANPFSAPLSSRYDELDGQMWFDDVAVPWNRVFLTEPSPEPVARWLFWHQLYCWLAKAEFTLGLALACTQAMGLAAHEPTIEYLLDLITDVQTVRSCQTATELDPEFTAEGYCSPNHGHLAAGSLAMLKARRRMAEILRILPGSSLVVAPTDRDLADPALAGGLEESFAGGGYSAMQRAALLQMAWDHVGSALDHREHVFELHANGGEFAWRGRLRRRFDRYNELANGVLQGLSVAMPEINLELDPQRAAGGAATGEPPRSPARSGHKKRSSLMRDRPRQLPSLALPGRPGEVSFLWPARNPDRDPTPSSVRHQERHRAGRNHLGGRAAQPQEVGQPAMPVGAHHQKVGFLFPGILQQGTAAGTARNGAGIHLLHRGGDAATAEVAQKKGRADIVGLLAGDDDRHRAGFFEKGQCVSHGPRGLRAAVPGNDHGRDRFFAGIWRRIRRGDHDRTGAVVDGGLDRRRGDVVGIRAGPADQQDAGEAPQGDELVARDVFATGEGGAGDRGDQLAKGPFGIRGASLQPSVGQGL